MASADAFVETWAEVKLAIIAAQGNIIVYVDDGIAPAHVPGVSGVTDGNGRMEIRPYRPDVNAFSTLTIDDGATIKGLARLTSTIYLLCDCQSATPSLDWDYTPNAVGTPMPVLFATDRAALSSTPTSTEPAIIVPAAQTLLVQFQQEGGVFQPPGPALFSVGDGATLLLAAHAAELRDETGINLVPSTWVVGTGQVAFDYDQSTIYISGGQPQYGVTGGVHRHNSTTDAVEIIFLASTTDVLALYHAEGRISEVGTLHLTAEGFGGTGGGGGGAGGGAAPGSSGGGSGGVVYSVGSFDLDLSHQLDITLGDGGSAGAAGVAGDGAGGDGAPGTPSFCTDATAAKILWSAPGSEGGKGASATFGVGGMAIDQTGAPLSSAGFPSAGGDGSLQGVPGKTGNRGALSLFGADAPGAVNVWEGGAGGTSAGGQGGGGGGGGAGPRASGSVGGNSSGGAGGAGTDSTDNLGNGAGGGAGGAGAGDAGGPGGAGKKGYVRLLFFANTDH